MSSLDADYLSLRRHPTYRWGVTIWPRWGLLLSALLLAVSPLFIDPSYSIMTETLSQAGGQHVEMAWVFRTGVALASLSVFIMTNIGTPMWGRRALRWFRLYALALLLLVLFPASPWDGSSFDQQVALLHTYAAVCGGIAFILGVISVSSQRTVRRGFDLFVVAAIAIIPQLMLLSPVPGLLQRVMVTIGYVWLLLEAGQMADELRFPLLDSSDPA